MKWELTMKKSEPIPQEAVGMLIVFVEDRGDQVRFVLELKGESA